MKKRIKNKNILALQHKGLLYAQKSKPIQKSKRELILNNNSLLDILIHSSFLKPQMISESEQKMIFKDLSFTQSHQSRRSVILAKELQIICEEAEVKSVFEDLFHPDLIGQILETYLYGLNVFEVNYKLKNSYYFPYLVQRDFRNFGFDEEGMLCYYGFGNERRVEDRKAIYGLFGSNFLLPCGDCLIAKLYFPIKLKNASLKFWMEFLERFGSPWAVAKTDSDPNALAYEIHQMLNGDSAVIDKEEELDLIQPKDKASYNEIIAYLDNQIRSVILGANLSSQVSSGSLAATQAHNQIRKDLAAQDAKIVLFILNRALKFFKEINAFDKELYVQFFNEAEPKNELCERDLKLFNMGFSFDEEYIKNTYNVEGKLLKQEDKEATKFENKKSPQSNAPYLYYHKAQPDALDNIEASLESEAFLKLDTKIKEQIQTSFNQFLNESKSYEEAFKKLEKHFSTFDKNALEDFMFKTLSNASVLGYLED